MGSCVLLLMQVIASDAGHAACLWLALDGDHVALYNASASVCATLAGVRTAAL